MLNPAVVVLRITDLLILRNYFALQSEEPTSWQYVHGRPKYNPESSAPQGCNDPSYRPRSDSIPSKERRRDRTPTRKEEPRKLKKKSFPRTDLPSSIHAPQHAVAPAHDPSTNIPPVPRNLQQLRATTSSTHNPSTYVHTDYRVHSNYVSPAQQSTSYVIQPITPSTSSVPAQVPPNRDSLDHVGPNHGAQALSPQPSVPHAPGLPTARTYQRGRHDTLTGERQSALRVPPRRPSHSPSPSYTRPQQVSLIPCLRGNLRVFGI